MRVGLQVRGHITLGKDIRFRQVRGGSWLFIYGLAGQLKINKIILDTLVIWDLREVEVERRVKSVSEPWVFSDRLRLQRQVSWPLPLIHDLVNKIHSVHCALSFQSDIPGPHLP